MSLAVLGCSTLVPGCIVLTCIVHLLTPVRFSEPSAASMAIIDFRNSLPWSRHHVGATACPTTVDYHRVRCITTGEISPASDGYSVVIVLISLIAR